MKQSSSGRRGTRRVAAVAAALATLVAASGCGPDLKIESRWADRAMTVDGLNTEWGGALADVEDADLSFGVRNDEDHAYVALFLGDPDLQRQVAAAGLTVWFRPEEDGDALLGIRHPTAAGPPGGSPGGGPGGLGARRSRAGSPEESEADAEARLTAALDAGTRAIEFRFGEGPGEAFHRAVDEAEGVEVAVRRQDGVLAYELRIPLAESEGRPWAIGAAPGETIEVRLEVGGLGEPDRPARPPGGRGGGGPGGARGGGRGGPRGGPPGDRPEPLELRARVRLATPVATPEDSAQGPAVSRVEGLEGGKTGRNPRAAGPTAGKDETT